MFANEISGAGAEIGSRCWRWAYFETKLLWEKFLSQKFNNFMNWYHWTLCERDIWIWKGTKDYLAAVSWGATTAHRGVALPSWANGPVQVGYRLPSSQHLRWHRRAWQSGPRVAFAPLHDQEHEQERRGRERKRCNSNAPCNYIIYGESLKEHGGVDLVVDPCVSGRHIYTRRHQMDMDTSCNSTSTDGKKLSNPGAEKRKKCVKTDLWGLAFSFVALVGHLREQTNNSIMFIDHKKLEVASPSGPWKFRIRSGRFPPIYIRIIHPKQIISMQHNIIPWGHRRRRTRHRRTRKKVWWPLCSGEAFWKKDIIYNAAGIIIWALLDLVKWSWPLS